MPTNARADTCVSSRGNYVSGHYGKLQLCLHIILNINLCLTYNNNAPDLAKYWCNHFTEGNIIINGGKNSLVCFRCGDSID